MEAFAKENSFVYRAEPLVCHACAAMERAQKAYAGQEGADDSGLTARLTYGPHGPIA